MKRIAMMFVALFLGMVLFGGNSTAGTIWIPVWGTQNATTIDPGRQWTDADGVLHYRDLIQTAELAGADIDGIPFTGAAVYVVNINIDPATGDGDTNIQGTIELAYGDRSGTLAGRSIGTITGFLVDGTINYPRGSDGLEGWKLRGVWTHVFGSGYTEWEGSFQIPGGNKASTVEATTWSGVKSLYR